MTALILLLLVALAAANGANDVSKGIATLAGAGVTRYRTAVVWGAVTTLLGALLSIQLGGGMGSLFSKGIIGGPPPGAVFALAVLCGTTAWVAFASVVRLPVSTTHAIVGSLVGAGLLLASDAVRWQGVLQKVALPMLLSIAVAYVLSLALTIGTSRALRLHRARTVSSVRVDGSVAATAKVGLRESSVERGDTTPRVRRILSAAHWFSSGATSCARGLNDTPKIAAVGGFALIPAGYSTTEVALIVAVAMTLGSLLGIRVARTLGEKVVKMGHGEGFRANLTTAVLVGAGATLALPMSTTHVSTGAIVGSAGGNLSRVNGKTLRDFVLAWTVTPVCAGVVAAVVYIVAA